MVEILHDEKINKNKKGWDMDEILGFIFALTPERYLPNILSMESLEGRVQLKMENCLLSLCGMSLRPPPGWIMAARNWMSTMLVNSPGFSKLKNPFCSMS